MAVEDFKLHIPQLREKFMNGENVMEAAAKLMGEGVNSPEAIDFSYDLQAGSYTQLALANPSLVEERAILRESLLRPLIEDIDQPEICEAGSGESTTIVALANLLSDLECHFRGFDTASQG